MEKLMINDSYKNKLETIIKRSDRELEENELIKVLLFRQYFMFLKAPKSYTVNLYEKKRIKPGDDSIVINCPTEYYKKIEDELIKAQSDLRFDTGREVISESKVLANKLINKMLYEEISILYSAKSEFKRYKKCNFRKVKKILANIINTQVYSADLEKEINKHGIDKKHLIYYMMLSVNVPKSMTFVKMLSEKFINDVINRKVHALELYLIEAQNGLEYRDIQDKLLQYTYSDLISYQIRQSMKENPNYIEEISYKSVNILKEDIRTQYKEEEEYY